MISNLRVLAVIPARKGSKRLIGKNIKKFAGMPLICHTILAANNSKYIDEVLVSTDCSKVSKIAAFYGCSLHKRSPELSSDTATTIDLLKEIVKRKRGFDIILTLQPTSPLRISKDIDESLQLFISKKARAVISVYKTEHPPNWINPLNAEGEMGAFSDALKLSNINTINTDFYALNGAIYCNSTKQLSAEASLIYQRGSYAYIMPKNRSVDIDTLEDFELAELYYEHSSIHEDRYVLDK